ncbi:ArsR family transcriptional regulator [Bacillus thuringiensis]|uniref:ArsR/SmtB family transcription factor n=1 Tax=Bacillus wiedmannii TaxID=1890302 RepID=UPI000CD91A88|nr:metalloregulator ArsR/SmtB family transcription factor [Bacillus wiedmannii]MBG9585158.1 ArsR family transcriptional regulator [Bacillus thuringiensis]MDA2583332.1 metalloregulator ArsR/SmtB family transcription factor [Bacillus cereus]MBG9585162.1 ArsR family transcriptional regulator [Bacillus thuringiensis]MBG9827805.1 ArsR family transcriptional regulator [Bacillus wiedmannii]MED3329723.1 metalloregulator ArsR/SmtB family transcription factor [Bacillus thuringiensis]
MAKIFQMDAIDYEQHAEILKSLAHPMRLLIVQKLITMGSLNVSELQNLIYLPQSVVSQHLSKLKIPKIVSYERKGLEVYYKVIDKKIIETIQILGLLKSFDIDGVKW